MLDRGAALATIVESLRDRDFVVCGLGYLSRDLYARTAAVRDRCLYCMGSMGSVVPTALGVSLARPAVRVLALEGDGSLLMNLGSLVTLRRYGSGRVRLIVFDNNCYESTGGQPSQPAGFELADVCGAVGLATAIARDEAQIKEFLADTGVRALVVKTARGKASPRIPQEPASIAAAFTSRVTRCGSGW
jgi:thiamine pyrophosphate-dependent acetolactate synthase large subunit-like protein